MSSGGYTILRNEEDHSTEENTAVVAAVEDGASTTQPSVTNSDTPIMPSDCPPPYMPSADTELKPEEYSSDLPPLYADIIKPPAYQENIDDEDLPTDAEQNNQHLHSLFRSWGFLRDNDAENESNREVGTDVGFVLCFMLSIVFNWLGFLMAYCFTQSLACHYGAFAGLGLSFVKWSFIIKHSDCCKDYMGESPWVMWIFVMIGMIIFMRGILSYGQLKRWQYRQAMGAERRFFIWN